MLVKARGEIMKKAVDGNVGRFSISFDIDGLTRTTLPSLIMLDRF